MIFNNDNLQEKLLEGIASMGIKTPTPIQEKAIPFILQGRDVIACAQTGTGKTAAYLIPVLNEVSKDESRQSSTLIIAPTRELAIQIDQQTEALGYFLGVSSIAIYGGGSGDEWDKQRKALRLGVDIIIATPGRLIALLASGEMKFKELKTLILDEADRMLDMGFYNDILKIVHYLPKKKQTLLFSATMPTKIRRLAEALLVNPAEINIAISQPAAGVQQLGYLVYQKQKTPLLIKLLNENKDSSSIVFCSTRENVKVLEREMKREGIAVKSFHSDLDQKEREDILRQFKNKQIDVLIGTDVLSRGIDIENIELVINYDLPPDLENYVHRIGRTARAAKKGTAVTFVEDTTYKKYTTMQANLTTKIHFLDVPQEYGDVPNLEELQQRYKRKKSRNKRPSNKPKKV